jgi:hypothetical protein
MFQEDDQYLSQQKNYRVLYRFGTASPPDKSKEGQVSPGTRSYHG